jgi:hypothetical protein
VKPCSAALFPPNRLVYQDAFDGVSGDVLYVYAKSGFEQNVVLLERPPTPEQFGLRSETTLLQVWTEFIEAPEPIKREVALPPSASSGNAGLIDESLDFADIVSPMGKAFLVGNSDALNAEGAAQVGPHRLGTDDVPVGKQWIKTAGRTFLIESASYPELEPQLKQLKVAAAERGLDSADLLNSPKSTVASGIERTPLFRTMR